MTARGSTLLPASLLDSLAGWHPTVTRASGDMKCVDRLVLPWRPPLVAVLALLVMSRAGAGPAQAQQPGIFLAQGWSNVLYLGPSGPIATGLGWLGGEVSEVIIWDPENQRWHAYYPSVPAGG